jgi:lysophospholipase L1-like esterase
MVLAGFAVAVVGAEILLRIWTRVTNPPLYELDTQLGWKHASNVDRRLDVEGGGTVRFVTDARGLRVMPHASERVPGERRVLFSGDSFTQGSQVEGSEVFPALVERALPRMQCIDAGVGGYSTMQEWRALPALLAQYSPDLVVLVLYENDFQDNLLPYYSFLGPRPYVRVTGDVVEAIDAPDPRPFERFLMPAPGAMWCYEHCAIYRALHKNVFLQLRGLELAELEAKERAAVADADARTAMSWLLARIAATVREANRELLVVAIPAREDVKAGASPSHEWLARVCERLGVPFVSALAALREVGAERAYFAMDIHLTASGHECMAALLQAPIAAMLERHN